MEFLKECTVAITISLWSKYLEKSGEKLGERTNKQLAKLLNNIEAMPDNTFSVLKPSQERPFPKDFEAVTREMMKVANQNPGLKRDIIEVVAVAREEHPTYVNSIEAEIDSHKLQGITAEKINAVFQGNTISGGNVGNTGVFQNTTIQGDVKF